MAFDEQNGALSCILSHFGYLLKNKKIPLAVSVCFYFKDSHYDIIGVLKVEVSFSRKLLGFE